MIKNKSIWMMFAVLLLGLCMIIACGDDDDDAVGTKGLSEADFDKFIGNWAGTYECVDIAPAMADTLFIAEGTGDVDFIVTLHAGTGDPSVVNGTLEDADTIEIPEQEIAGYPGTAVISFENNKLSLIQEGLGIVCNGSDYQKY